MRNFGFAGGDRVEAVGINGKLNEAAAAMGLCSLEAVEEFRRANRENYACYLSELASLPGIRMAEYDGRVPCSFQSIVLEVDAREFGLGRDELQRVLWRENVLARRYFSPPCHQAKPYCEMPAYAGVHLPSTEALSKCVLSLPNGTAVSVDDVEGVCALIRFAAENANRIRASADEVPAPGGVG